MDDNRLMRVSISPEFLQDLMTVGYELVHIKCIQGLPPGAKLVRSYNDEQRQCGVLVFSHPDFAGVPWGADIPELDILHETTR